MKYISYTFLTVRVTFKFFFTNYSQNKSKFSRYLPDLPNEKVLFENYKNNWESLMLRIHEEYGSWENRKGYKKYELIEVS